MAAATPDLAFEPRGLFIGGEWVTAHGGHTITSINPANGELLGAVPLADEHDVDRAVAAASAAFPAWAALPVTRRAEYLRRLAAAVERNADHLALMDAVDSGNAISGMRGDMAWTAEALRYFAGLVTEVKGETMAREPGHLNLTLRQPYGVVARINPFNHPFRFCAEKAASALAAGNTVVIKGPEQAPLSSLKLGELCAEIFPPGVVNIVTGDGGTGSPWCVTGTWRGSASSARWRPDASSPARPPRASRKSPWSSAERTRSSSSPTPTPPRPRRWR